MGRHLPHQQPAGATDDDPHPRGNPDPSRHSPGHDARLYPPILSSQTLSVVQAKTIGKTLGRHERANPAINCGSIVLVCTRGLSIGAGLQGTTHGRLPPRAFPRVIDFRVICQIFTSQRQQPTAGLFSQQPLTPNVALA